MKRPTRRRLDSSAMTLRQVFGRDSTANVRRMRAHPEP